MELISHLLNQHFLTFLDLPDRFAQHGAGLWAGDDYDRIEQGIATKPAGHEWDETPLVSLVFTIQKMCCLFGPPIH